MTHDKTESNTAEQTTDRRRGLPAWKVVTAFAILLAFLSLIWWGLRRAQQGPITIGQHVPPFSMITFDGETYNTADLTGKVVLVNFWASWCKPCEQEAAELEAVWKLYEPDGEVLFFGLDYVDTEPEARGYLDKFGITYPNGPDLRTEVSQMFRIRGVPETYIIDRQGNLAHIKIGPYTSQGEIIAALEEVLAQ